MTSKLAPAKAFPFAVMVIVSRIESLNGGEEAFALTADAKKKVIIAKLENMLFMLIGLCA